MSDYRLSVNGVELPCREIEVQTDPGGEKQVHVKAKDAVIPTEDLTRLVDSLSVSDANNSVIETLRNMADELEEDPRPNNGVKEGACCLECYSVIFNVGKLLRHIENRNHYWFKSGDDLVLNARTLVEDPDRVFEE